VIGGILEVTFSLLDIARGDYWSAPGGLTFVVALIMFYSAVLSIYRGAYFTAVADMIETMVEAEAISMPVPYAIHLLRRDLAAKAGNRRWPGVSTT
jgi:hypothetical protein